MDKGYDGFCLTDSLFYDTPTLARQDDVDFHVATRTVPTGWTKTALEDWLVVSPTTLDLPLQGWKIHVSGSLADAAAIIARVWDYCIPLDIPFKFVRSQQLLLLANSKYAHRGSSGKFVTIYPRDDQQFESVTRELGAILADFRGPYILSDLRWENGPVYVRYGAFSERFCLGAAGELVPALADSQGRLVPDVRGSTFAPPAWVDVPEFLAPALAARASANFSDLPYRVERALHFSNGGGVYLAKDTRTGERVVMKEARPDAGLAIDGSDAVERLRNEESMIRRLADLGVVPAIRDRIVVDGHHFLVEEYIDAVPLGRLMVDRYPLALLGDDRRFEEYTSWACQQVAKVRDVVHAVHSRGIVLGDLHPQNVLIRDGGEVVLVDLEIASDVDAGLAPSMADPGFVAPHGCVGFEVDEYALACILLSLFIPLTELINLDEGKVDQFALEIRERFPVPADLLDEAVNVVHAAHRRAQPTATPPATMPTDWPVTLQSEPSQWPQIRDSLAASILSSATPDRTDRLFPGDIAQFDGGAVNLAYGASGVLLALTQAGVEARTEHQRWLVTHALDLESGTRFGLYDGLFGVAYALERIGLVEDGWDVLSVCRRELKGVWADLGQDLFSGLSGMGLVLTHFARLGGDRELWQEALQMADVVADDLSDPDDDAHMSSGRTGRAGLTRGGAGAALLFLRLYDEQPDEALLDVAAAALRRDLRRCVLRDDGALEVNEGYRTMPYLHDGSVGIGMVLDEFLLRRADQEFAVASEQIRVAALAEFYIESGLFSGRAGMIAYLAERGGDAEMLAQHVRRLMWHAVRYNGSLAFPGDQLMRLSMDLGTGTAGVLMSLAAALHDEPVRLPFFGPQPGGPRSHNSTDLRG